MKLKLFLIILSLFNLCACADINVDYVVCKPYLKILEDGSGQLSYWDMHRHRDANGVCHEYIEQEFVPVEIPPEETN